MSLKIATLLGENLSWENPGEMYEVSVFLSSRTMKIKVEEQQNELCSCLLTYFIHT